MAPIVVMTAEREADFGQQLVAHNAVTNTDCRRETFRIGAAVALDDNAVEAQKHAAVRTPRVDALLQLAKRGAGEQIADARAERAAHGVPDVFTHLPRRAFGGFQSDVAGKAFGDDDIDLAEADIVAFDEADIIEVRQFLLAQHAARLAHRL